MWKARERGKTCLHKHLGTTVTLSRSAVHRHGLPVTGELQSDVLLHQLLDHLLVDTGKKMLAPNSPSVRNCLSIIVRVN